mmetsp:Transcript_13327/g.36835  ORF Transcript_13327/g.36835 Transcript_13327/m.36835 type:complete len:285 (-) Transcript_13327:320-1174(-)|eukprot:CAMPEP_0198109674 /NCGR_PEP_ID=MMETSP1442-20131203/1728_1 /TAXON_ID= /ORGANISM="Craspedostauros australis, Strain CCMP3328" /LENGTH=284 /DNA_ID=CAMNT_0043765445 /DNA_START=64 /DNA_END=918 /DNA_ORIENTATION=+
MTNNIVDDSTMSVLVLGATGATGHHVVQKLLDKGHDVKAIVRSKDKLMQLLKDDKEKHAGNLSVTEASLLDLTSEQLEEQTKDCHAVVCCLGHNLSVEGIWGHPRRLVTDSVERISDKMPQGCKFILMNSDGVAHPDGTTDQVRPLSERTVLFMLRYMIPPHADNEAAAAYLYERKDSISWCIVRPTDLVDGEEKDYQVFDSPPGSLFGGGTATRASVASFMADLATDADTWAKYKHKMPVLHNTTASADAAAAAATTAQGETKTNDNVAADDEEEETAEAMKR